MGAGYGKDRHKWSVRLLGHLLSEEKCQRILLTFNQLECVSLPPWQFVPTPADQKLFYSCGEDFV